MTDERSKVSPTDPLESLVRDAAPRAFAPGFAGRVHARMLAESAHELPHALERQFVRIVPLLAAASLMLAVYNWWSTHETAASAFDAALNLPQVSVSSAYASSSLFGATGTGTETP
jgi:hypothetical protein